MSDAGEKVRAAIERHNAAITSSRQVAKEIADERAKSVERVGAVPLATHGTDALADRERT